MKHDAINALSGANMDIDLVSENVGWNQAGCPWNEAEQTREHKCAVKALRSANTFAESNIWTACFAVIRMKAKMC